MRAAVALHADEAVFQAPTRQVVAEFIEDLSAQWTLALGEAALEGRQLLLHGYHDAVGLVGRTDRECNGGRWIQGLRDIPRITLSADYWDNRAASDHLSSATD